MEFATTGLRDRLLEELARAAAADIAVAYFSPDQETLSALGDVPKLRLLVADDFRVNNPYRLEVLSTRHWVRASSPELHSGNLHAKVYLIRRRDRSVWAMVGSANLTGPGLATNQEACLILDSKQADDTNTLSAIQRWMSQQLGKVFKEIDFELAKAVFDAQNPQGGSGGAAGGTAATEYWALKPGECGKHWQRFLAERVMSIGWASLPNISDMTLDEAAARYRIAYPDHKHGSADFNCSQILKFTQSVDVGHLVLLCGRFDSVGTVDKPAHIYGVARVVEVEGGSFFFDEDSDWHRFKRHAVIQEINRAIPRSKLIATLGTGSFVPTIRTLTEDGFAALEMLLRDELGVVLRI